MGRLAEAGVFFVVALEGDHLRASPQQSVTVR
jgi:hypothetical protein